MTKWRKTIRIKDALGDSSDAAAIVRAADTIIERLSGSGAPFAKIEKARDIAHHDPETAFLVFNDGLNTLYDWADMERVWIA